LGRSKGGFGTKFHLVTDGDAVPLAVTFTAGQVSEIKQAEAVIGQALKTLMARKRAKRRRKHKPDQAAGDKAYSARRFRDWLIGQKIEPVIPHKENEKARHDPTVWFDRRSYRGRAVIEQCIGWLKEFRRIATRYEKLQVNFEGMFHLAMIKRYFKLLF
jgi:transposase